MKIDGETIYIEEADRKKTIDFDESIVKKTMTKAMPFLRDFDFENVYIENVIQQLAKDGYILPYDGRVEARMFWGAAITYILGRKGIKASIKLKDTSSQFYPKDYKMKFKKKG